MIVGSKRRHLSGDLVCLTSMVPEEWCSNRRADYSFEAILATASRIILGRSAGQKIRKVFAARAFVVMMKNKLVCLIILALHLHAFAQVVPRGTQLKAVYEKGRWGYADAGGRVVIAARFDAALPFAGGLARVATTEGKKQLIDATGKVVWHL
jgi:WG containing repeat